jgi:hypothetical protein
VDLFLSRKSLMIMLDYRNGVNAARSSVANSSGYSHIAK